MLPKLKFFINSDECIGKNAYKSITSFYLKKRLEVNKKQIFSSEKLRKSGNCILIMFTRSSARIFNPMRYNGTSRLYLDCILIMLAHSSARTFNPMRYNGTSRLYLEHADRVVIWEVRQSCPLFAHKSEGQRNCCIRTQSNLFACQWRKNLLSPK